MVVDIAPQQQLTEVFTTNHNHHWSTSSSSSSTSSSTHRRSSATIPNTSAVTDNNSNTTMTHGYRSWSNELGRKAEQILGQPKAVLDCPRQTSLDFHAQHPPRLNITASKPSISSRNNFSNSTTVHNQSTIISSQSESASGKAKQAITCEHLVPFILKLVAAPKYSKVPEMISGHLSNSKRIGNIMESREMTRILHEETSVKLSDDENEEDDDEIRNPNTVLTELTDKKIDQTNSNDIQPLPHAYENQIEPPQHSGLSSNSRCPEDEDSEDDDSDNQEAVHSDAENDDDETNETNRDTLSLMDFIQAKEIPPEPVELIGDTSAKLRKRSISPEIKREAVHNSEDHQNKRQKLLIKRTLLKSFMSSVNTRINFKNPSLPIAIPTHFFFEQSASSSSSEDERSQRTSKRYASGSFKQEITADVTDSVSQQSSTNIQQKKAKTSQIQEKNPSKQEPPSSNKNEQANPFPTNASNQTNGNATDRTPLQATVTPMINTQQKKEKPTANVKPLLQSASIDNLSAVNSIGNGINNADSLTTSNSRLILPSVKLNYTKLKNMSKTELAALARKKKKQADHGKRTTFAEAREAMGLYLESVCYFIQCANEESKQDQRTSLLTTTLTMLQQLAQNHKKMFHLSTAHQSGDFYSLQQKFLLINYWLQALIYHLQYQLTIPSVDRCAGQVTDYFNQIKNPSSTRMNHQAQLTPVNETNPLSPLSNSSDLSTASANNDQHRSIYEFSKLMLNSYHSTSYWNKAEHLMKDKPLKEFTEQLLKQNQNRRLSRDDPTLDYLLYIFDSIELLRLSVA